MDTALDIRARNRILPLLFVGVLMGALDIAIVGPALPAIQQDFGVSERDIAWIFTIYVLFNLIGTPLMAKLSDAFGRRSVYVLDIAMFAAGSLVVALAPGLGVLLAGRALQGLGAGGIFPVASAVIGDVFPAEQRGRPLGMIGAVFGIAFLIGPILGGVLLIFGWQWLFLVNLPIAAVVIVLALRLLPGQRRTARHPFDWPGMLALGVMLAALAYALNQIDTDNFVASASTGRVWPFLLLALVLIPVFVAIERRVPDPILRLSLFSSRQVGLASLFSMGAGLSESGLVFVPALLVAAFGVSSSSASFMLIPPVLAMAVAPPVAGRLLDQQGSKVVIMLATALLAAGMVMLAVFPATLVLYYGAGILIGLGLSALLGAPLRYIMLNEAPVAERAAAQGAITLFGSVGQLLGGALVGAVAASRGGGVDGYQAAYLVIGIIAALLLVLGAGLKGREAEMATARRNEGRQQVANP